MGFRKIDHAPSQWTRALFAPLVFKYFPTEEEYAISGDEVHNLASSLFSNINGIEYEDMTLSGTAISIHFFTTNLAGERKIRKFTDHPLEFRRRRRWSEDLLNPIPKLIREEFFAAVDGIWDTLVSDFRWQSRQGRLQIFARINSAVAPFSEIAPDAFEHFEMIDWQRGTALASNNEQLFSVHAFRASDESASLPKVPEHGRSRPLQDRARLLMNIIYGENVPGESSVSNKDLESRVNAEAKKQNLQPLGRDSILRAAGRATDRRTRK